MVSILRPLLLTALMLVPLRGMHCGEKSNKPRSNGPDGGHPFRPECMKPTDDCFERCHQRGTRGPCYSCCDDQGFLCDTQQKYSYEYCDGAP